MKRTVLQNSLIAVAAILSFSLALPVVAGAQSSRAEEAKTAAAERKEQAQTRLADAKLKACKAREKSISNIMIRTADRGEKQLDLFTHIAEQTRTFYTEKGRTIENYEALVEDVLAKRSAAEVTIEETKNLTVAFACDGADPKGAAGVFKDKLKAQNDALKEYKTSVRNLIVGVKSAQGAESSGTTKPNTDATPDTKTDTTQDVGGTE